MLPIILLFLITTLGMQYNNDVEIIQTVLSDEEIYQKMLEATDERWESEKNKIYDPTKTEYFMNELVISHPVVVEEVNLSLLLSEAISFHFSEIINKCAKNTELTNENVLFDEFLSIFIGCSLSPIDYNEHPWGGGYYVQGNRFYHDNYFRYGYLPEDLEGIVVMDKTMDDYAMIDFTFIISDTERMTLVIFDNYNAILSKITLEEELISYEYQLPYRLEGESREILEKINHFLESTEYKVFQQLEA